MGPTLRNFALWVVVVLMLLALFTLFQNPSPRTTAQEISYSQFINEVEQGRIRGVVIQGPEIHGNFTDGRSFLTYAPNDPTLMSRLLGKGVSVTARSQQNDVPWFVSLLLSWLPFIALIGVWIFLSRQMQQAGGSKAGHPDSEVAALKRQIEDLKREIERLKESPMPPG
jgi:cell division protease FtsH